MQFLMFLLFLQKTFTHMQFLMFMVFLQKTFTQREYISNRICNVVIISARPLCFSYVSLSLQFGHFVKQFCQGFTNTCLYLSCKTCLSSHAIYFPKAISPQPPPQPQHFQVLNEQCIWAKMPLLIKLFHIFQTNVKPHFEQWLNMGWCGTTGGPQRGLRGVAALIMLIHWWTPPPPPWCALCVLYSSKQSSAMQTHSSSAPCSAMRPLLCRLLPPHMSQQSPCLCSPFPARTLCAPPSLILVTASNLQMVCSKRTQHCNC